jgi:glyoxylase-like metal-dependent hydrolase (beta-lactamase superfamily II)
MFSTFARSTRSAVFAAMVLALTSTTARRVPAAAASPPPTYDVFAVRFGVLPQYPVASLVASGDKDQKLDIPVMVWVLKGSDARIVLVDSGFHDDRFVTRWHVRNFTTPAAALARLGIQPDEVSDVILTHMHWDHADGVDLFPKATVWIQKEEYQYYTGEAWHDPKRRGAGADIDVMTKLVKRNMSGLMRFVAGDDQEILPGVTCYTGGRHTYASQYVGVNTIKGVVIIASDNVYLYQNLTMHAAIAQTLDAASNLQAMDRMRTLSSASGIIVPGHDPEVFSRFRPVAEGIVHIVGDRPSFAR